MAQRFRATNNRKSPRHSEPNAKRKSRLLTDEHVEALREFADEDANLLGYYPDSKVFGLSIFLGAKSSVWRFRQQSRIKGKRSSVFKTLGNWPAMDTDEARKQALIYSGSVAAGATAPGKRQAMPFRTAFENYLAHLKAQAEAKGKAAAGAATRSVPVITFGFDPIELGFAASYARPGGNVTGVVILVAELEAKRLSILLEAVPDRRRVAALVPAPNGANEVALRKAAAGLGIELLVFPAATPADYPAAPQFPCRSQRGRSSLFDELLCCCFTLRAIRKYNPVLPHFGRCSMS